MTDLRATADDVRYAYRLLLGREADPDGYSHFHAPTATQALSALELSLCSIESAEFLAKHGDRIKPDGGNESTSHLVFECRSSVTLDGFRIKSLKTVHHE
jgi:hypothetical protein